MDQHEIYSFIHRYDVEYVIIIKYSKKIDKRIKHKTTYCLHMK